MYCYGKKLLVCLGLTALVGLCLCAQLGAVKNGSQKNIEDRLEKQYAWLSGQKRLAIFRGVRKRISEAHKNKQLRMLPFKGLLKEFSDNGVIIPEEPAGQCKLLLLLKLPIFTEIKHWHTWKPEYVQDVLDRAERSLIEKAQIKNGDRIQQPQQPINNVMFNPVLNFQIFRILQMQQPQVQQVQVQQPQVQQPVQGLCSLLITESSLPNKNGKQPDQETGPSSLFYEYDGDFNTDGAKTPPPDEPELLEALFNRQRRDKDNKKLENQKSVQEKDKTPRDNTVWNMQPEEYPEEYKDDEDEQ
jgi:hypothetical protein